MRVDLIYFIGMNSSAKKWNAILEVQRQADLRRERQQKEYRQLLRNKYKKQLEKQIQQEKLAKDKFIKDQKFRDKMSIDQTAQQYKRNIEFWKSGNQENQSKGYLKPSMSSSLNPEYHKDAIDLLTNDFNAKKHEKQFQSQHRIQPYPGSGSSNSTPVNSSIRKNHSEASLHSSRHENPTSFLKKSSHVHNFEEEYRIKKHQLEEELGTNLKKDIMQREKNKKQNHNNEVSKEMDYMNTYQKFSYSLDLQKKYEKSLKKKQLNDYLAKQINEKKKIGFTPISKREINVHQPLFREGSQVIIPGETYMLDPQRKKQLETVAKSISSERRGYGENQYLANRGKTILG